MNQYGRPFKDAYELRVELRAERGRPFALEFRCPGLIGYSLVGLLGRVPDSYDSIRALLKTLFSSKLLVGIVGLFRSAYSAVFLPR